MVYFCPHLLILSGTPYPTLCNRLIEEGGKETDKGVNIPEIGCTKSGNRPRLGINKFLYILIIYKEKSLLKLLIYYINIHF